MSWARARNGEPQILMWSKICRCCGLPMREGSPRNPHVCLACEQLLEDMDDTRKESLEPKGREEAKTEAPSARYALN